MASEFPLILQLAIMNRRWTWDQILVLLVAIKQYV